MSKCASLDSIPSVLGVENLTQLLQEIDRLNVCADIHFVKLVLAKKDKILSKDGKNVACIDKCVATVNGESCTQTVRRSDCELLSSSPKCNVRVIEQVYELCIANGVSVL